MYGLISSKAAEELARPEVEDHFTRLVQRVSPKSYAQAQAEVVVTRRFLSNFSEDQVTRRQILLLLTPGTCRRHCS
jgi:1-pyrroline-5-carboxylate dehydrogenase